MWKMIVNRKGSVHVKSKLMMCSDSTSDLCLHTAHIQIKLVKIRSRPKYWLTDNNSSLPPETVMRIIQFNFQPLKKLYIQ